MLFAAKMIFLFWGDSREMCWCDGRVMVVYSALRRCRGRANALCVEWGVGGALVARGWNVGGANLWW